MATNFDVLIARNFLDSHANWGISRGSRLVKPRLRECLSWRACLSRRSLGTPKTGTHLPKLFLATVLVIVVLIVSIFYSARNYLPLLIFGADFRELSLLSPNGTQCCLFDTWVHCRDCTHCYERTTQTDKELIL